MRSLINQLKFLISYKKNYFNKFIKYSKLIDMRLSDIVKYSLIGLSTKFKYDHSTGELINSTMVDLSSIIETSKVDNSYELSDRLVKVMTVNFKVVSELIRIPIVKYVSKNLSPDSKRLMNSYLYDLDKRSNKP